MKMLHKVYIYYLVKYIILLCQVYCITWSSILYYFAKYIVCTMQLIHITTLRKILSSPEPIDIRLWTRSGEIQSWHRCISLKYDFYKGTRRMKLLDSNEIRQLRDVCIFEVNGIEVYM